MNLGNIDFSDVLYPSQVIETVISGDEIYDPEDIEAATEDLESFYKKKKPKDFSIEFEEFSEEDGEVLATVTFKSNNSSNEKKLDTWLAEASKDQGKHQFAIFYCKKVTDKEFYIFANYTHNVGSVYEAAGKGPLQLSIEDRSKAIKALQKEYIGKFPIQYFKTNDDGKHDRIIAEINKEDAKKAEKFMFGLVKKLNDKPTGITFLYKKGKYRNFA